MALELMKTFEDMMVAVTFSEKNQHDTALKFLDPATKKSRSQNVGEKANRQAHEQPRMRL